MFEIDRESRRPAYMQIYRQIRQRIETGELPAGSKLPKIRELAATLGVARNTVEAAYKQLALEGYAQGVRGVGCIVEKLDLSVLENRCTEQQAEREPAPQSWFHETPLGDTFGCKYNFAYGDRTARKMPLATIKSLADQILTEENLTDSARYIDPYGLPRLRKQIARSLRQTRDMSCDYTQVILQPGTQLALRNIVTLFDPEERIVAMEDPGYDSARNALGLGAASLVPVPAHLGSDALVGALEKSGAKIVFLTPSNQFPMGHIMPLATRLKVIDWARRNDAYIIEDDYCCEYRYNSSPVPSLNSLDPERAIYLGTMSKILSPAIRTSYIVLPHKLQAKWDQIHSIDFCALPWLDQEILGRFMETDTWGRYVRSTVNLYRRRHDALMDTISREMGDAVTVLGANAGVHILVGDNEGRDQEELIELARRNGVRVYHTHRYWMNPNHPLRNYVLVGFSAVDEDIIRPGIKKLAKAWYG